MKYGYRIIFTSIYIVISKVLTLNMVLHLYFQYILI